MAGAAFHNLLSLAQDQTDQASVFGVVLFPEEPFRGLDAAHNEHDHDSGWGVGSWKALEEYRAG